MHANFVKSPTSYRWLAKHRKPIKHLKVVFSEGRTNKHVHIALAQLKDLLKWCPVGVLEVVIQQGASAQMARSPVGDGPLDLSFLHKAAGPENHPVRVLLDIAHVPYNKKSMRVLLPESRVIGFLRINCSGKVTLVGDCLIKHVEAVAPLGTPNNRAAVYWDEKSAPVIEWSEFRGKMMVTSTLLTNVVE